jgi:glucosyl-dolichyl phosphate glucuronosyltransferase
MIDDSIVIATFNRAHSLCRALESFCRLRIEERVEWELVVVDNNSTDHTKQVCKAFTEALPLSYLFQPMQGKTRAQNLGISNSTGSFLLFTDDDVDLDTHWLTAITSAARNVEEADFFGGKVLPKWEQPPPAWVTENADILAGIVMRYDRGDASHFIEWHDNPFFGANMAFRRRIVAAGHLFDPNLGHRGELLTPDEDTDFMRALMKQGVRGYYVPSAVVHHRNPVERATERFLRLWFKGAGMVSVRKKGYGNRRHLWFGAPRHIWRKVLVSTGRYALTRWSRPSRVWIRHEIAMSSCWGAISEYRAIRNVS